MIEYHVIHRDEDLDAVREFLSEVDERGRENIPIAYPTVVARDNEDLVGCMTTRDSKEAVMVGAVESQGQRFVLLRMAQAYDHVMKSLGVKQYLIPVDLHAKPLLRILEKLYGPPYAYDAQHAWFKRSL